MSVKMKVVSKDLAAPKPRKVIQIRLSVEMVDKIKKLEPKHASCPSKIRAIIEHIVNNPNIVLDLKQ